METYFQINTLPRQALDPNQFPLFTPALAADMGVETRKFLDNALWNGDLTDLLLSRTAFVNTVLAANIYGITVPAGATTTNFVQTTLPARPAVGVADERGVPHRPRRLDGQSLVVPRGLLVDTVLLCMPSRRRPTDAASRRPGADRAGAGRGARGAAGLQQLPRPVRSVRPRARELRRHRALPDDRRPRPADRRARDAARGDGGGAVANGVELAQKLAANPAFTNCMARVLLQYAMVDPDHHASRCRCRRSRRAARRPTSFSGTRAPAASTFTDLVRATAASPAFVLRRAGAMTSYRFRRRAFLTALSGGVGLKIMLRTLEGSAQGMRSPAAAAGHALAGRDRGGARATRCGSRRRAAWAARPRSSRSPTPASGPT